ncbi:MAG: thermonuclease family protein, partial [Rhizobiaceae bacterium]
EERAAALRARDGLARFVGDGRVSLVEISGDKYFGRVIADLVTPDGRHASDFLLNGGHARAYAGKTRSPWCG